MADYFENMCIGLPLKKGADKKKRAWWKKVDEALCRAYDENSPTQEFLNTLLPEEARDCTVCEISIEEDAVYLTDDGGVLQSDGVVGILQAYLQKFDPKGVICVEIAFTSSEHRPDGFGGCAIVVTATDSRFKNLGMACDELLAELGVEGRRVRTVKYD